MTGLERALIPANLNGLSLRNRVIKAATFEGMTPGGVPSDQLIEHHATLARGGVGLTTVAYCAVSPDGRTFADQMAATDDAQPGLRALCDAVHAADGRVALQLGHCGGFSKNHAPKGPSAAINYYGISAGFPRTRAMSEGDIEGVITQFAAAGAWAVEAGVDALELHLGHGYLLSQFLSPATNRRRDQWGGTLEGRLRLPLAVIAAVRGAVGAGYPILCKVNLRDGFAGGLDLPESIEIARALEDASVDALVLSGGSVAKNAFYLLRGGRPLAEMVQVEKDRFQKVALAVFGQFLVKKHEYTPMFFFDDAREIRAAVKMPLVLLGGIASADAITQAMDAGFDFVQMGRALISDPDLIDRLAAGTTETARCDHCNLCIPEMDREGIRCMLED